LHRTNSYLSCDDSSPVPMFQIHPGLVVLSRW
jgi:hypothetical protein